MSNNLQINHQTIEQDFLEHLNIENNNRILFTAPFGTGKSTFLKTFFGQHKEDFLTIKLFPVNYCVSANEDVFELIKYDLLLELTGNHKDEIALDKSDFSNLILSQMFLLEEIKLTPLLLAVIKQCGKIGKSAVEILEEVKNQYKAFKEKIEIDEEKFIIDYAEKLEKQKGTPYEMDAISYLIKDLVERIKTKNKDKRSVLIIDDLDRLDPEHIFRLFNIFSAHYDRIDNSNKFNFDIVIFVGDYTNIRKIFHHRYGQDVDFTGYSDKFFSLVPFYFDNRQFIREQITNILSRIEFTGESRIHSFNETEVSQKQYHRFFICTKSIVQSLLLCNLLNLRSLINYPPLIIPNHIFHLTADQPYSPVNFPIITFFYLLKNFYYTFEEVRKKLEYLQSNLDRKTLTSSSNEYKLNNERSFEQIVSYCIPFFIEDKYREVLDKTTLDNEVLTCYSDELRLYFHFSLSNSMYNTSRQTIFRFATESKEKDAKDINLNPYEILLMTFDKCRKIGAIR